MLSITRATSALPTLLPAIDENSMANPVAYDRAVPILLVKICNKQPTSVVMKIPDRAEFSLAPQDGRRRVMMEAHDGHVH